jgi:hypothetical protein
MMAVYIPTLSRYDSLEKIVPAWLEQDIPITLVVDPKELKAHVRFRDGKGWRGFVSIARVPFDDRGIGYKRRYCVTHAWNMGYGAIIMSDDDHKPREGTDAGWLLYEANKPGVLGVGAVIQIYARFTGGAINKLSGPILWPGGAGFSVYGLNVETAMECGNFDERLHSFGEDAELRRQGLARGIPWRVHADVRCDAVNQRNSPGGFMAKFNGDLAARQAAELACRELIYERWPQYVSSPDKPPRMAWQAMLEHYVPRWRSLSALHGGTL